MMRLFHRPDYETISEWYKERNLPPPSESSLPATGFIVPEVAAGFLTTTDSDICFLDGYISNPKSDKTERDYALDDITDALLAIANGMGFKHVLVMTRNQSIEERARYWGFSLIGMHKLMHREID
jgi:hypothetical protein